MTSVRCAAAWLDQKPAATQPLVGQTGHPCPNILHSVCLPEAPVQWDLLSKKDVVQASFWTVLCYYSNVRHLHTSSNKFAQVGMIELPAGAGGVKICAG